jgi:mRNA-degrading endonuclease RelE of RelBE toxin-antitoxin system
MTYYNQTYPWLPPEPAVSQTPETPVEGELLTAEKPTKPSEKSEAQKPSKPPITLAIGATEKLFTQRRQQESAAFMKKIQISRSTYARAVAEVGAAGPIRTTMLDELAVGLTTPYTLEPNTPYTPPAETTFPYTTQPYTSTAQPASPQLPRQITASPKAIKINVFADTDKEDLKDLERKISRILSEQVADLGAAGPIRTTMLDELAVGLTTPYTLEPYTPQAETVSQQPLIQSPISPASQDTINVNVFANTAEEDLRDLERKIRRILAEQISRYYGSSRI